MRIPTRAAILIGAPSHGQNFLYGVEKDKKNVARYLQSSQGGGWNSNEIFIPEMSITQADFAQLQRVQVDYSIVYFSGHGFVTETGEQMLVFQNGAASVRSLINHSPRQLIIIDACRTYTGARISGPEISDGYASFDGFSEARELFDKYILNSPPGITIVYATQRGTAAIDHPIGGYFTTALLNASVSQRAEYRHQAVTVDSLIKPIRSRLQHLGNNQIPEVCKVAGNLQVPFALSFADHERAAIQFKAHQPTSTGEWVGAAGLLFLLIAALAVSK
ncbi:MAG: caspase family protein [Chitinophagaceae bacterium]